MNIPKHLKEHAVLGINQPATGLGIPSWMIGGRTRGGSGRPLKGLSAESPIVSVTNLLAATNDPRSLTGTGWGGTAGFAVDSNQLKSIGTVGSAVRNSAAVDLSAKQNKQLLLVVDGFSNTVLPLQSGVTGLYPRLRGLFADNGVGSYVASDDNFTGYADHGQDMVLRPRRMMHYARFTSLSNASNNCVFSLKDEATNVVPAVYNIPYVGLYDITGQFGNILHDSTYGYYFDFRRMIVGWGDSMMAHGLYHLRDAAGIIFPVCSSWAGGTSTQVLSNFNGQNWAATTAFKAGDVINPGDGNAYLIYTAGTTGGSQPTWATSVGAKTTDGTAVWTCLGTFTSLYNQPTIIWSGHNDPTGGVSGDTTLSNIAAMVAQLTGPYRILSIHYNTGWSPRGANNNQIDYVNRNLRETYGANFIDVNPTLMKSGTGSATDATNIARNMIPASLLSDTIHLNDFGSDVVGDMLYADTNGTFT